MTVLRMIELMWLYLQGSQEINAVIPKFIRRAYYILRSFYDGWLSNIDGSSINSKPLPEKKNLWNGAIIMCLKPRSVQTCKRHGARRGRGSDDFEFARRQPQEVICCLHLPASYWGLGFNCPSPPSPLPSCLVEAMSTRKKTSSVHIWNISPNW